MRQYLWALVRYSYSLAASQFGKKERKRKGVEGVK
jgi:hypothetical protein